MITLARGGTLLHGRASPVPCSTVGVAWAAAVAVVVAAVVVVAAAAVAAAEKESYLGQLFLGKSPAWLGISSEATAVWTGRACHPCLLLLLLLPSPFQTCDRPPDPSRALTEAPSD